MRPTYILYLFAILLPTSVADLRGESRPAQTNSLFLTGIEESSPHYRYWAEVSDLAGNVKWCPESEPFPLDLGAESRRARMFLANSEAITNELKLTSLRIARLFVPERQANRYKLSRNDLTNQWFIGFSWRLEGSHQMSNRLARKEHVVMLLNGAFAKKTIKSTDNSGGPQSTPQFPSRNMSPGRSAPEPSSHAAKPFAMLEDPKFPLPSIQWDPETESIPVDLHGQANRALGHIAKNFGTSEGLMLKEIWLGNYTPVKVIDAQGKSITKNLHHWVITFSFARIARPTEADFDVNMLLDGRMLNALRNR